MNAKEFAHELEKAASFIRQQQAEIETYKLELYDEVMLRREQQAEIEALKQIIDANNLIQNIGQFVKPQEKCPPTSWWKGDPTCGGIAENYGLGKAQEK